MPARRPQASDAGRARADRAGAAAAAGSRVRGDRRQGVRRSLMMLAEGIARVAQKRPRRPAMAIRRADAVTGVFAGIS